jgi:hypothetical protein
MHVARLPDIVRRWGLMMPRRSVFKRQWVGRRRASTGITVSIEKGTESAGTFVATGRTNPEVVEKRSRSPGTDFGRSLLAVTSVESSHLT